MQPLAARPWITAGVALVGAGAIAATPVTVPLPDTYPISIQLLSGALDITLDLVRHGQSVDNVDGILGTTPPGAALTAEGVAQAQYLANPGNPQHLDAPGSYDGIYASTFLRAQETAQGWLNAAGAPDASVTLLSGLNEVNAGVLDGNPLNTLTELHYLLPQLMWILGLYFVPMPGSTIDPNGMAFEDRFSDAVQTIYDNSAGPNATDVAFSHAGAITAWALMNVKNPDFGLVIKELIDTHSPLSNTGQVVLDGNPTDGWTLVSWDGTPVPENPGLGTELFVDFRDLIVAPQMAYWHIHEAIVSGDWASVLPAIQTGFHDVLTALLQFPLAVYQDIIGALHDAGSTAATAAAELAADTLAAA